MHNQFLRGLCALLFCVVTFLGCSPRGESAYPSEQIVAEGLPANEGHTTSVVDELGESDRCSAGGVAEPYFANYDYPWIPKYEAAWFKGQRSVKLTNGRFLTGKADDEEFDTVVEQFECDVTGDGQPETLIYLSLGLPNRGWPASLFVFSNDEARPRLLWQHESGSFDVKGLKSFYRQDDGSLAIEEYDISDSPMCCPNAYYKSVFLWDGNSFVLKTETKLPHNGKRR